MFNKFTKFFVYMRQYGLINALLFSVFKLSPKSFGLVAQRVRLDNKSHTPSTNAEYLNIIRSICNYDNWSSYGGASEAIPESKNAKTIVWFVPDWTNVWGGGHFTLFRFANYFASKGTHNIIFIYNNERHYTPRKLQAELDNALTDCQLEVVVDPMLLPSCSAAVATTWQSAYQVKAFPFVEHKFYFMQDYESLFYPSGTAAMQANASYSFGFHGITGGAWLKSLYEKHGGKAENYIFAADKHIFYPLRDDALIRANVKRVFFYGRPSTERRCFELGIASLMKISATFPDIEIVIAGLELNHTPPFKATLMGNMPLDETGDLYRSCDIGIAFSGTNLSYLPVELMASGIPVLSNNGPQVEWMLTDRVNSYLVDPTPQSVFEGFSSLYLDVELRQAIARGGVNTMKYLTWDSEMEKIYKYVSSVIM
ncbi:MAG: glycosyltransferase family 4 protein [Acidithiobacillus sp.]